MPITYLLIDLENVKPSASEVQQLRSDHFRLLIFRGPHQTKYDSDVVEAWQPLGAQVQFIHCKKAGKNALDFHIAFCLGMAHRENVAAKRLARYVVVSKDGGLDTLVEFARSERCYVAKAPTILAAIAAAEKMDLVESPGATAPVGDLPQPASSQNQSAPVAKAPSAKAAPSAKKAAKKSGAKRGTMNLEDVAKIVTFLREQPQHRPGKRSALERHIVTHLGNKITEKVASAVVDRLVQDKLLTVTGDKIEYRLGKK